MSELTRQKFVGGWPGILLGILQMAFAGAAAIIWGSGGLQPLVWALAGFALLFTLVSLLLYHRPGNSSQRR
ncbi:MAG TPA: hypothetical protein VFD58_22800 [Blastocatellia bacterium]|nr:hypothetical protein [Blastocatellia bacterium]